MNFDVTMLGLDAVVIYSKVVLYVGGQLRMILTDALNNCTIVYNFTSEVYYYFWLM